MVTGDLIIGPQGVAVYAELDPDVTQWYKVQDAVPHVSLMVSKDCQPKDLGPMMKASKEVNWIKTDNKYIHRSADGAYYRIAMKSVDRTVAEKVLVDRFQPASHYVLTEEQEEILKQVPDELWTKHHTDVGLVKSAGEVLIKLKPHVRLPYQRQYPLSTAAYEGIKPTIEGLVEAGVLDRKSVV